MAHAPTLTPRSDMAPVPRVEIVFATVAAGTATATVYRLAGGRTWRVRGGVRVAAAGGFAIVDPECPFNTPATYRAEQFDAAGLSLGYTDGTTATLAFDGTVIHQPLDSSRAVLVGVELGSAAEYLPSHAVGERVQPKGRPVPVWIGFGRSSAASGIPLRLWTDTAADEQALRGVFGGVDDPQSSVVCIRSSELRSLPSPLFATVDFTRVMFDESTGGEVVRWQGTADEVAPPAEMVLTAILTYADLEASYTSYSDIEAAYLTYLAAESDFSLAGTA